MCSFINFHNFGEWFFSTRWPISCKTTYSITLLGAFTKLTFKLIVPLKVALPHLLFNFFINIFLGLTFNKIEYFSINKLKIAGATMNNHFSYIVLTLFFFTWAINTSFENSKKSLFSSLTTFRMQFFPR